MFVDASVLGLSTRTCSEWLQLAFQLKWVLGEVADIFARKYHTPIVNLLLRFETMYILLIWKATLRHSCWSLSLR